MSGVSAIYKIQAGVSPTGAAITRTASPANGVSVVASTGDGVACKVASLRGTGINSDVLTNTAEAV